jgi:hypothetical protein
MTITYPVIQFVLDTGVLEFSRLQVLSAELVEETTALSIDLSINTIKFKIKTDTFSMFTESVLAERTPIIVSEVVDGVVRLLGKFYLDTWKNITQQITEFSAIDIVGVMDSTDFDGAFLETDTLVSSLLSGILVPINVSYSLDAAFSATTLKGWIPPGNYRDAMKQIAFAIGATVITSRLEILSIVPAVIPNLTYTYEIAETQKISGQSAIEKLPLVSNIELVSHNYTKKATVETFFDKYLAAGSYKIVYDQPYTDIVITGPGYTQSTLGTEGGDEIGTENGDQLEAGGEFVTGSNATYLTILTAGQVTFTGYQWLDSKQSFTVSNPDVTNKNTLVISDATLISIDNAQGILDLVDDYYRQRYTQTIKILPSNIEVGDIVLSSTIYDTNIMAYVQKATTDLCKGFTAKLTMRGFIPTFVPPEASPTRRARTGVAVTGSNLTHNNQWRQYA